MAAAKFAVKNFQMSKPEFKKLNDDIKKARCKNDMDKALKQVVKYLYTV